MEIAELRLKTHDLNALRGFYVDLLDIALLDEMYGEYFTVDAGETRLRFDQGDEDEIYQYHFAFNIPHNQLADAKAWLAQRTRLIEHDDEDEFEYTSWQATAIYFRDPVGNVGEFIARHAVDNDSSIPFSGQSIRRVSEIGLVVDSVSAARDLLRARLQPALDLPIWKEGDAQFSALGDNLGLFILVAEGRTWFPTADARARSAPVQMRIYGDQHLQFDWQEYQIEVTPRPRLSASWV